MTQTDATPPAWRDEVYDSLKAAGVEILAYVPDAGHSRAIQRAVDDPEMEAIVLTTEEEGVALAAGAWLGGKKAALLMQSSGVGNCINMLGLMQSCRFPFLTLVTMRGEWEEFNPWQKPMGGAVPAVFEAMGVEVRRIAEADQVAPMIAAAAQEAFGDDRAIALVISQKLIGKKVW
jgi:sulfopyruvate decarboxylase alpha subunit